MKGYGFLAAAAGALLSLQVHAQTLSCPDAAVLEKLLAFDDLFLGEIHGTVEGPQLVQCLVDKALASTTETLIVSLELSELARNPGSPLWKHDAREMEDGRTSQAMYALVMDLVDKERQQLLELHFQHGGFSRPGTEAIGLELKALSERGRLIAYAGNAHNMNRIPPGSNITQLQEGQYVGPGVTHINISSAGGGSFWACRPNCGVGELAPRAEAPNMLVDGASTGHDYIFYLERFTASLPMNVSTP